MILITFFQLSFHMNKSYSVKAYGWEEINSIGQEREEGKVLHFSLLSNIQFVSNC